MGLKVAPVNAVLQSLRRFAVQRRGWFVVAVAVLLAYAGVGFILFPWILHHQLERRLAAALHRDVSIQRVRANPFVLSITIDGFLVKDRDGSPFISWERLFVKGRVLPLLNREADLSALQLTRLRARVRLAKDGSLNFSDLLLPSSTGEPSDTATPPRRPFVLGVDQLALEEAQLDFTDVSHHQPFHTTVGPFTIRLEAFRTRADAKNPYAFSGTTEAGETFSWSGSVHIDPIRSQGTLTLEGIRLPKYTPYYEQNVDFDLIDGTFRVQGTYQLEWGPQKRVARLSDGALAVRSLALRLRGTAESAIELPELNVSGVQADLLEEAATVEAVSLRGMTVRLVRDRDGHINLTRLAPRPEEHPPTHPGPTKTAKPFRWTVNKVQLSDVRVLFTDLLPASPVRVELAPLAVTVSNLSSDHSALSTLVVSTGWNGTGHLAADGNVSLWKPAADLSLHLQGLTLPPVDGYLPLYGGVDARLGDGRLNLEGRLHVDAAADALVYGFDGNASLDALALLDTQRGQELIRWKSLQVLGLHLTSQPQAFSAHSVRWIEPRVKIQIAADGSSNVRRVLRAGPAAPGAAAAPSTKPAPKDASSPSPISIATFQIVRGSVGLVDRSVQPVALFEMSDVDLRIRGLSNDLAARAQVELQATVEGGPLKVSGTLSPRMKNDATDLKITSKGIDLTPLAPYFGKYVGFGLEKGKLDLDLGYKVAQRHLDATNLVRVDQLTLGEETHSPDATKLPVKLGLAVLQDRDGIIELDVPVDGNVDDPDFRLGKLIWHAIGNIFTKIVTAPFAALGALFGAGSERLDLVDFTPGTAEVNAKGEKTLQNLAKALYSRPALKLEIQGTVDAEADGSVLRRQALRQQAREQKWKAQQGHRGAAASPDGVELLEDEFVKFIEADYQHTFPKDGKQPAPSVTEMEERLSAAVELSPEALPALGRRRGEVARDRILQSAQVEPERLFLVEGGERATKEKGPRVYFTLK